MLETDQQIDVNDCPKDPGRPTTNSPPPEVEDGSVAPDDRRVAAIVKLKRLRSAALTNLLRKCMPKVLPFLFCDLSKTRQRGATFARYDRQIAQRKYVRIAGNG